VVNVWESLSLQIGYAKAVLVVVPVLDPVSVCDVAEKRSKTRAYQTEPGDTTKAPWSRPGGLIMTGSRR
jgi:hypothetical protein